jgi:ribonuclease HI
MRWERMMFKKNKVWVAVDANNTPIDNSGKVLIKYQLDQEHEYWVHSRNVTPIPEGPVETKTTSRVPDPAQEAKSDIKTYHKLSNKDHSIEIYTDGASSGNPGPSGIGILLRFGQHEREISRFIGHATNNIAELEAIRIALKELKVVDKPVRIYTDSKYAYGVLTMGWKAKKNQALINDIKSLMSRFQNMEMIKVPGHAGHEGNERADALATSAIKTAEG